MQRRRSFKFIKEELPRSSSSSSGLINSIPDSSYADSATPTTPTHHPHTNRRPSPTLQQPKSLSGIIPLAYIQFDNDLVVGEGGMAVVKKAKFMGHEVAVKSLTFSTSDTDPLKRLRLFVQEAEKMREINHPRIVKYYGFVLESFSM